MKAIQLVQNKHGRLRECKPGEEPGLVAYSFSPKELEMVIRALSADHRKPIPAALAAKLREAQITGANNGSN